MTDAAATAPRPPKRSQHASALLLAILMRGLFLTARKEFSGKDYLQAQFAANEGFILAAWHNRNICAPFAWLAHRPKGRVFRPLASASRDGTLAALTMNRLGVQCIRGSSSRGGAKALREMIRAARAGHDLGITPDGPRGPRYVVQPGVIAAAQITGLPIIGMSYDAERKTVLRSWDRMIVPHPFTRLHFAYSAPLRVPRDADAATLEQCRQTLEQQLLELGRLTAFGEPV